MRFKIPAVIDPGVFEAYLRSESFFTTELFGLIEIGVVIPLFDSRLLDGYYGVLRSANSENDATEALRKLVRNGYLTENIGQTAAEILERNELTLFEIKEPPEDPDELMDGNAVSPQTVLAVLAELDRAIYPVSTQEARERNAELIDRFLSRPEFISGEKLVKDLFGD